MGEPLCLRELGPSSVSDARLVRGLPWNNVRTVMTSFGDRFATDSAHRDASASASATTRQRECLEPWQHEPVCIEKACRLLSCFCRCMLGFLDTLCSATRRLRTSIPLTHTHTHTPPRTIAIPTKTDEMASKSGGTAASGFTEDDQERLYHATLASSLAKGSRVGLGFGGGASSSASAGAGRKGEKDDKPPRDDDREQQQQQQQQNRRRRQRKEEEEKGSGGDRWRMGSSKSRSRSPSRGGGGRGSRGKVDARRGACLWSNQ